VIDALHAAVKAVLQDQAVANKIRGARVPSGRRDAGAIRKGCEGRGEIRRETVASGKLAVD
jgi:hypothetical protein